MKRQLLVAEFLATPWALMPDRMNAISSMLTRWQSGAAASDEVMAGVHADREARDTRRMQNVRAGGGSIAVIPVYGVITQRRIAADQVSGDGGCNTQEISAALRACMADDSIGQILMDFSTPGGSVYGIAELAAEIMQARTTKPVVAIANSQCGSAGYWLASAASELYVTPGGEVGSIGVWQAHEDVSKAMADAGVTVKLISAGRFKVEGNPYEPLSEEGLAFMQSRVDDYYQAFIAGVGKGRGVSAATVRSSMGEGRMYGAEAAVAAKMADGVMTFDDVVRKMQKAGGKAAPAKPAGVSRLAAATRALQLHC